MGGPLAPPAPPPPPIPQQLPPTAGVGGPGGLLVGLGHPGGVHHQHLVHGGIGGTEHTSSVTTNTSSTTATNNTGADGAPDHGIGDGGGVATDDILALDEEITELKRENARVELQMLRLKSNINAMESQLNNNNSNSSNNNNNGHEPKLLEIGTRGIT